MGVTGLWKLIEPCGQPVPVEMLESKILAIDISIWLHQVVKGFQDNRGSALANAHLLGLFHRLCKLMYYRIKPVFVFDGKVPSLKKETIAKRNLKRNKLINEADRIQTLLLQSLAKEKVVQQALGSKAAAELLKASPSKTRALQQQPDIDDMFKLPELPTIKETSEESDINTTFESTSTTDLDSSFEESKPAYHYNQNLQAIDVKSKYFRNLPADVRHEILIDIKETRKQSSWGKLHELPSKSTDFSVYQMKRLLKRRQVQESLEEVEKEMDGVRAFTLSELEVILSEEGIIEPSTLPNTKHISSDANTRFLLVRDLKETLANAAAAAAAADSEEVELKPESSASALARNKAQSESNQDVLGDEYDDELQRAIQMSLDESTVYSKSDYEPCETFKLNKEQRKHLKNAAVGLARAYMIEHAGMNDDDVQGLLEHTQAFSDDELSTPDGFNDEKKTAEIPIQCPNEEKQVETTPKQTGMHQSVSSFSVDIKEEKTLSSLKTVDSNSDIVSVTPNKEAKAGNESPIIKTKIEAIAEDEIGLISDSDSDSEQEKDSSSNSETKLISNGGKQNGSLEIFVDTTKAVIQDNDLFADVFSSTTINKIEDKPQQSNITKILEDLKKQASEVHKINLNDIKLDASVIEISDDESLRLSQNLIGESESAVLNSETSVDISAQQHNHSIEDASTEIPKPDIENKSTEVIEIVDDTIVTKISPVYLTPSKTKPISEFFETKYVVKRTPEKSTESIEDVPKVKSPFFIKKTPKSSGEKRQTQNSATDDESSPQKKARKSSKVLFLNSHEAAAESKETKEEGGEQPNTLQMAANLLKENKSRDELEGLASSIAKEKTDLEKERNRQDRMGMTITERMNSECMQLLNLFGVPFIVAPMEAEAQCAFLDAMQLTNGTITDDSDIWLFGGRTVYKNFFAQNKHVMEFKSDKIENVFNVNRAKLIQLALLVGSDYTTGVNGIGAVTALEILATFSSNEAKKELTNQQTAEVLQTLRNFHDWWASTKSTIVIGNSTRHRLRNKLKNIELIEGFPSPAVVQAYLTPTVDNSQDKFSWGSPDVESIREFTRRNFGWTRLKTDEILGPVLKKINEKKSQSTIKNYFAVKSSLAIKQMPVSKRVQSAINKMSADYKSDEEKEVKSKPKRGKRKPAAVPDSTNEVKETIPKKSARVSKKTVKPIPSSSEIIPQRQKDKEEMEQKKALAAAILLKSKSKQKKN